MEPNSAGNGNGIAERRRHAITVMLIEKPTITQRGIMDALSEEPSLWNPHTGSPYSLGTINNDLQVIRRAWMERAAQSYGNWVSEQVARLDRLEERAWRDGEYAIVIRCIDRRCKLLGLDEPTRLIVDWRQEAQEMGLEPGDVFERYVEAAAEALAACAETD